MTRLLARLSMCAACMASAGTISAAPAKTKSPAPNVKDLTKQVEVVTSGRLRVRDDGYAEVSVTLWNNSDRDVEGPIFVIIDGSGLDDVTIANCPELTEKGKGVFQIIGDEKRLMSHGMTPNVPLVFKAPQDLTQSRANSFVLATRVFGREGLLNQAAQDEQDDASFAVQGKSYDLAALNQAKAIQERNTASLMKIKGVIGTAIGETASGDLSLRVHTETRGQAKQLPSEVEGLPVTVVAVPGGFKAGPAWDTTTRTPDGVTSASTRRKMAAESAVKGDATVVPTDTHVRFDRPVPIGVSSINAVEICASGTLGCRCIDKSGKLYALSNCHVFARASSGTRGEAIVQPSQGDNNCFADVANDTIGTLADFVPFAFVTATTTTLPLNFIDCGLMDVENATDPEGNTVPAVGFATPVDGYGVPQSKIRRTNRVGLQVQKFGRTTIYTRGYTVATNVSNIVAYETGDAFFFGMDEFVGMLPSTALGQPGDSGSLIVTLEDRRPVDLLFAGAGLITLGNPISRVLSRFNVQIDDGSNANATTSGDINTAGVSGRQGINGGNLGTEDIAFLPPELWGRVKNPKQGLLPIPPGAVAP